VAVVVTAANTDDRPGLVALLQRYFASGIKRLRKIWVDGGYQAQWLCAWVRSLKQTHKINLERVALACMVSTDYRLATTEADWYEPIHWYATRSKSRRAHGQGVPGREAPLGRKNKVFADYREPSKAYKSS